MDEQKDGFLAYIKVIFYFPLCWVVGGVLAISLLHFLGVSENLKIAAYFLVGIGGTVWFALDKQK
ncbi:hypothetical protein JQC92_02260 [Shewanella sp. 202IG2-18]|uniref:hypothetical protein n=1 Tax=Parashewanella hymeniacidonis TaxID=2807618 RepID=UPI0019605850|nr:hypothetical protein [Parashewanella hymeniacidonis]MBM7070864.1 hypothetical protein [Parashewanella hymeniacidonis]